MNVRSGPEMQVKIHRKDLPLNLREMDKDSMWVKLVIADAGH